LDPTQDFNCSRNTEAATLGETKQCSKTRDSKLSPNLRDQREDAEIAKPLK
jgi:hypothetical protein